MGILAARHSLFLCAIALLLSCEKGTETDLPVTTIPVEQPCEVLEGCRAANDFLSVVVVFGSQARALQPFPLQLRLDGHHQVESATVAFSMIGMDMGLNRYQLAGDAMSAWNASVTLPICVSGRTDWVADFELLVDGRRFRLQIPFVLEK